MESQAESKTMFFGQWPEMPWKKNASNQSGGSWPEPEKEESK